MTFVAVLLLSSQAFAVNAITMSWWDSLYVYGDTTKILYDLIDTTTAKIPTAEVADSTDGGAARATTAKVADSSTRNFNALFFGGGYWDNEVSVAVRATAGTAYIIVDNKYSPGEVIELWLSSDGEGGLDGGDLQKYNWAMPDSVSLSAGTATSVQGNCVYVIYNSESPALWANGVQAQFGVAGDLIDSMAFIADVGLGEVSGSDAQIRFFNVDTPSLYKNILRTTLHGWHPDYHSGIDVTVEEGTHTIAIDRGFLHTGTESNLVPAATTDDVLLYVPVYNDSNYARWDELDNFAEYSDGTAIGVPHYFWVVVWGAISADTTEYKLYMNIQDGTNTYLTLAQAQQDQNRMIPLGIPEEFHQTGFLIAGMIIRASNNETQDVGDGTAWVDLREVAAGGGGGTGGPHTDSTQVDSWDFMLRAEFDDSLDAADYLDSSNIANQGITPDDIDTTDNDFVFSNVYRGMSSQAESVMVTIETIEDSLALRHKYGDTLSRAFVIAYPTDAFDFPFWQTKRAITIVAVSAICKSGTNVIGALDEYDGAASGVDAPVDADWTVTTSEYTDASFTNPDLDAGDWLGWHTTSVSGEVVTFSITFEYTETY